MEYRFTCSHSLQRAMNVWVKFVFLGFEFILQTRNLCGNGDWMSASSAKHSTVKNGGALWGAGGKEHRELRLFADALSRMNDRNRKLLFAMAQKMASHSKD
jgi:hypothetical protein